MSTKEPSTNRQQQAIQTKKKLLKAGREVFLQSGFQKTTISQIIKTANTGYGTAYVYFKNKNDLFIELMEELMIKFYEIAEKPFEPTTRENAHEMIANQVNLFLSLAVKEREMMQIVKEAIGVSEEVNQEWKNIQERFIKRIAQDIHYAQSQNLAKQNLDPTLVARGWFYSNEMFMWELVDNESHHSMDEIIRHLTIIYTSGLYFQNQF
ncbi:TetR/AcrR family transcriptional regulator [Aquibacillus sp. 3ASR75-11]|uniref:TetR/AcrR family transcriptional regulator n=1 Tax=Terrihalobacillus insolitus TaxID=2950438 RepID=A0A9X3WSY7_9BACI|nr:TetR/AcrR family transcriptional regulator [Terrihalobacillus insolitus]MDC3413994.1 TetR/AcrR family transcriptional regulator [Terrihalobacillus insolitus]MDC3424083.1 TetR/AcrR family transcriptional regulator [Terrihalobacillus insolitus]